MLPDGCSRNTKTSFQMPDSIRYRRRTSFELGGIALNDASKGLMYQVWTLEADGNYVRLWADEVDPIILFEDPGIRQLSLAFDQNMRKVLAFEYRTGNVELVWFDTLLGEEVSSFYSDIRSPVLTMDDKREGQSDTSDIVFAYIRNSDHQLCYRIQRERFLDEHAIYQCNEHSRLLNMGMTNDFRFQFELRNL